MALLRLDDDHGNRVADLYPQLHSECRHMNDVTPVAEEDIKEKAHYDQFFGQDSVTISVKSVYRHTMNPKNLDKMALITQLEEIAKARGYNVTESMSQFTHTKYIHFKKYRLETPVAPVLQLQDTPKPEDIILDC